MYGSTSACFVCWWHRNSDSSTGSRLEAGMSRIVPDNNIPCTLSTRDVGDDNDDELSLLIMSHRRWSNSERAGWNHTVLEHPQMKRIHSTSGSLPSSHRGGNKYTNLCRHLDFSVNLD